MGDHQDQFDQAAWERMKRRSIPQLILQLARRLDEEAIARIREREGLTALKPAHTRLLPHVDLDGTRITELGERLGVSKQAASQLVDEMVQMGALERVPDPTDGRAKLVKFADPHSLFSGLDVLDEVGREAFSGSSDAERSLLRDMLREAIERLEPSSSGDP